MVDIAERLVIKTFTFLSECLQNAGNAISDKPNIHFLREILDPILVLGNNPLENVWSILWPRKDSPKQTC